MELAVESASDTIASETPLEIAWVEVDEHLWTATDAGNHLGVVEFVAGRFRVIDAFGAIIGASHSLGGARDLLALSLVRELQPASLGSTRALLGIELSPAHIAALITLTVSTVAALGLGAGLLS